ncbi:hypothetical protein SAMN02949497_3239 [Methylomagnum ishizawai]|uniref:Uncharacterized protein n=1 Tax=Methylomagnum ishizawai TaxID=1760988 RepID=A0A1Y6D4S6_9GAMM|nr:hypothetical protein [Methylomagnum ishizawai]SMF95863.1 hypothetical protein SAMN02949497_3239 [Methylomagnum ishizawai]
MSKQSQFLVTETVEADGSVTLSRKFGAGPVEYLTIDRIGRLHWTEVGGTQAGNGQDGGRPRTDERPSAMGMTDALRRAGGQTVATQQAAQHDGKESTPSGQTEAGKGWEAAFAKVNH